MAHKHKLINVNPWSGTENIVIDLSRPSSTTTYTDPVKVSTMKATHNVAVAGGFLGEYAIKSLNSNHATQIIGTITDDPNSITNHVDIIKHRTSRAPQAVFSSNDKYIRILDCETNTFITSHPCDFPVNCTDTTWSGRLRVLVGDSPITWVYDADTGEKVRPLPGHTDYGFACAISPDEHYIATSNQDKTVRIWDTRVWKCLRTIESDVAGYRSLRFSPVGGGSRCLLMCEPADRVVIVDAQGYQQRQVLDFFGEIGGADFVPDGSTFMVANLDSKFGGIMEFERRNWGHQFGLKYTTRREVEDRGDQYVREEPDEWIEEEKLDADERCVLKGRGGREARWMKTLGERELDEMVF